MSLIVKIHIDSMREEHWFPRSIRVPKDKEADFREWAMANHSQTVERLNERGGMDPTEIWMAWNHVHSIRGVTRHQKLEALRLYVDNAVEE